MEDAKYDMLIRNVKIYTVNGFCSGSIEITDGRISAVNSTNMDTSAARKNSSQHEHQDERNLQQEVDGGGCYALPGMIDMHFHGCGGDDVCDLSEGKPKYCGHQSRPFVLREDSSDQAMYDMWQRIADCQASFGVTGMAPAVMTLPAEHLRKTLHYAASFAKLQRESDTGGALLCGINMEGPFISPARCGAQDASFILPCEEELLQQFLDASEGLVRIVGVAPEKEGAMPFISKLQKQVRVSIAHTDADYETTRRAIAKGAEHVTHLFNAMPLWHHRNPGVVGAVADALAEGKEMTAELICDGIHVHPSMVRTAFNLLGGEHIVLVSDSMRALGMPDGEYLLGGQAVMKQGRHAVLKKDGLLAGSVVSLPDCVRTAVKEIGIPLTQAVACATINPARCLGIEKEQGSIEVGKRADIVLWNEALEQQMVICGGKRI